MKAKRKVYCLKEILDKAAQYDKEGKKELAKKWFDYAEKYEGIMERNRHTMVNRQILRK